MDIWFQKYLQYRQIHPSISNEKLYENLLNNIDDNIKDAFKQTTRVNNIGALIEYLKIHHRNVLDIESKNDEIKRSLKYLLSFMPLYNKLD